MWHCPSAQRMWSTCPLGTGPWRGMWLITGRGMGWGHIFSSSSSWDPGTLTRLAGIKKKMKKDTQTSLPHTALSLLQSLQVVLSLSGFFFFFFAHHFLL